MTEIMSVTLFDALLFILGKITSAGLHVHHADICSALLSGDIDGELYVRCDSKCYKLQNIL